jgi:hypothetical protein
MVGSRHCVNMGKLRHMVPWKIILGELFVSSRDDWVCLSVCICNESHSILQADFNMSKTLLRSL